MIIQITRQSYPTDLTEQEWKILEPLLPLASTRGRPMEYPMREIINAIIYFLRAGCAWRMLPHDLPPWQTVYYHFRKWQKDETWEKLNTTLREQVRQKEKREPTPSAAIIDSQSAKTTSVRAMPNDAPMTVLSNAASMLLSGAPMEKIKMMPNPT